MTPQERAENLKPKLLQLFRHTTDVNSALMDIAAQIEDAEREAKEAGRLFGYKECDQIFKFSKNYKDAYAEGFRAGHDARGCRPGEDDCKTCFHKGFEAARDKAKGIVDDERKSWGDSIAGGEIGKIAQRIGEMEP